MKTEIGDQITKLYDEIDALKKANRMLFQQRRTEMYEATSFMLEIMDKWDWDEKLLAFNEIDLIKLRKKVNDRLGMLTGNYIERGKKDVPFTHTH